jgi:hypothetical protein
MIRDLKGTIEREKAEIGVFITLGEPSSEMKLEPTTAGWPPRVPAHPLPRLGQLGRRTERTLGVCGSSYLIIRFR